MKVGKIKFVRRVHSTPLMQYDVTYWVNKYRKRVHIQGVGDSRVSGLDQIPENAEFSSANFVEKNGDYYLHVTCYLPKEVKRYDDKAIGIDLGVKDQVTFSNGVKIQYSVPMSQRLRRLYHFLSRAKLGSRNREKLLLKIRGEFEKQNNVKRDVINKMVHFVATNYSHVVFQGDNIHSWQKLFGKGIYKTSIGGLRDTLKRKASTPAKVPRFTRTTGVCPNCKYEVGLNLSDRKFTCPSCNSTFDRDVASAMVEYLRGIPHVSVSMNWEAPSVRAG